MSKVVDLSSDIQPSRKTLKGSLQNIYLMLDIYHKHNPIIMTVVEKVALFLKIFKTIIERKILEDITFIGVNTNDEIIINI